MERKTSLVNTPLGRKNSQDISWTKFNSADRDDTYNDYNNNYYNSSSSSNSNKTNGLNNNEVEDSNYVEECISSISVRLKRLKGVLENLNLHKETCRQEAAIARSKINQIADDLHSQIEQERTKLLRETEIFSENTDQELKKLQSELTESIRATEDFGNFVQNLQDSTSASSSPKQRAEQLIELRNQQRKLDTIKHEVVVASLKFRPNKALKGNLIGKLDINDADTSDPYVEQPQEIGVIEGNQMIAGITVLNGHIYVIRELLPNVEVYRAADLSRFKMLKLEGLRKPSDLAGDIISGHVYISDASGSIYKLQPDENILTKLPVDVSGEPQGINVVPAEASNAGNLLVTCYDSRQLKEFTPSGQLVRSIRFQQDVLSPWHVVPVLKGGWLGGGSGDVIRKFAVCHGWEGGKLHRVCWIDEYGKNLKTHGASNGSGAVKLDVPTRMVMDVFGYTFVVDRNNDRVVLLSPNLVYVRDIIAKSCGIRQPRRLHLDPTSGLLYLGLVDGSVRIFKLLENIAKAD